MHLIQDVWQDGKWTTLQKDEYKKISISKLCKRLCERAGMRNEHTSALKKHGCIILIRKGVKVRMQIILEEHERHKFVGEPKDYTTSSGSEVHAGRGSDSDVGRDGSDAADTGHQGDAEGVQAAPCVSDEHDCALHQPDQSGSSEEAAPGDKV